MNICLSPFNKMKNNSNSLPEEVIICDVTIRDGEQTPGVSFTIEEKISIVKKLNDMGVPQIQTHAAGTNEESRYEAESICQLDIDSQIEVMTYGTRRKWREHIQAAVECGADIIHSLIPMSEILRHMGSIVTDKEVLNRVEDVVKFIRVLTDKPINISLIDATRSDIDFLLKTVDILAQHGVERIRLADTAGVATPDGINYLIQKVKEKVSKYQHETIIGLHCHNDFGLALANVIAGVQAGARLIDVSVNGLGERAGNPSLAEVVVALDVLYGVKTNIQLEEIFDLAKHVEKLSNYSIPTNMPLVGEYAFTDESDLHVKVKKDNPLAFQGIKAEMVGNKSRYILGKNSGPYTIKLKCKELGIELPMDDKIYDQILKEITKLSENKKGQVITDDEFVRIVKNLSSIY